MTPTPVPPPTKYRSDFRNTVLSGKKFYNVDLSGQDLSKLKMRSSTFYQCRFDNADCTETDFTGSDLFGSSMVDTICYRTNFADAKLTSTNFQPKDCFGMTITMCCRTFQDMKISPLWWLVRHWC